MGSSPDMEWISKICSVPLGMMSGNAAILNCPWRDRIKSVNGVDGNISFLGTKVLKLPPQVKISSNASPAANAGRYFRIGRTKIPME